MEDTKGVSAASITEASTTPITAPSTTFNIGDRVTVKDHPTVGTIIETKVKDTELHYLVSRPIGSGNMSHWLPGTALHLVAAAPAVAAESTPVVMPPFPFQVGDVVRYIGTEFQYEKKVRTVRELRAPENDMPHLIVWKDEPAGKKSPEWKWYPSKCELVSPAPVEQPLTPAEMEHNVAAMFEKLQNDFVPPVPDVPAESSYSDTYVQRLHQELAAAEVLAAQELQRADAESKRAEKLEKQLTELQNMIAAGQPVAVKQAVCWDTKVLVQDLNELVDAERELTENYNQGWQKDSITVTTYYMFDGMASRAVHTRIVSLKRRVPTQPQRPQRGASASASPAAALTGQFVRESVELGPYSRAFRSSGREAALNEATEFAVNGVLARSAERRAAQPVLNRPLLSSKGVQS